MPLLKLTNEQVIELIEQLPAELQENIFKILLIKQWSNWMELSSYGQEKIKIVSEKYGQNWDEMTEEQKEAFIDDIVHEDRKCQ